MMRAEEIVAGLRICNNPKGHRCSECPIFSRYRHGVCKTTIDKRAAALIESQAAEIKRLNEMLADSFQGHLPEEGATQCYWWCPECCEEVDGSRVTYQEMHDTCGHFVLCIEPKDPIAELRAQLSASQQRERAMLSDMAHEMECGACCHVRVDVCDEPCASCRRESSKFKWRGPQEAVEGERDGD